MKVVLIARIDCFVRRDDVTSSILSGCNQAACIQHLLSPTGSPIDVTMPVYLGRPIEGVIMRILYAPSPDI